MMRILQGRCMALAGRETATARTSCFDSGLPVNNACACLRAVGSERSHQMAQDNNAVQEKEPGLEARNEEAPVAANATEVRGA